MICVEHGKSIIEHPKERGKTYDAWLGNRRKPSHRDELRQAIDAALEQKPASFEALLTLLQNDDYEIKRGKQISFRKASHKRFIRMDTLGEAYTEAAIQAVIAGSRMHTPAKRHVFVRDDRPVGLLVDVEAKLQAGNGAGYARWAKVFNAKQLAKTITFLSEHGFRDMDELRERADAASAQAKALLEKSREKDRRLKEVSAMRTQVIQYMRTKDVFAAYKRCGYSRSYLEAHDAEIAMHREAKRFFNAHGLHKLPTGKQLKEEYDALKAEKSEMYQAYCEARDAMRELLVVRENVERILKNHEEKETEHEKNRANR